MQEMNLIEEQDNPEEIVNNAPVVVNEVDINSLTIPTEEDLSRELGCDCLMNKAITYGVKETSYKCLNCPDHIKHMCLYCLENCHKTHINNLPSYLFKGDLIDFQKRPCECAKAHHKATVRKAIVHDDKDRTNCPFDQLFGLIKPKYAYRRKGDNKFYCLYCINNFSKQNDDVIKEERSSQEAGSSKRGSQLSAFGNLLKKSIEFVESEDKKANVEKENVRDDDNFYGKYEKVLVDPNEPYPSCDCNDDGDYAVTECFQPSLCHLSLPMRAGPRPVPISIGFIFLNSSESYTYYRTGAVDGQEYTRMLPGDGSFVQAGK